MDKEKQRIKIAEACGWHHFIINDEWGPDRALKPNQIFKTGCVFTEIPDYLSDLNVMREALILLNKGQRIDFVNHLLKIVPPDSTCILMDEYDTTEVSASTTPFALITAKEEYLAEAFLKTIGLWEN